MSSWYVFTEEEMAELERSFPRILEHVEEHGHVTKHMTVMAKLPGWMAFKLAAFNDKKPRRMAVDPPIDTRPA